MEVLSREGLLEKVEYRLVGRQSIAARRACGLHKEVMDLVAVYRLTFGTDEDGTTFGCTLTPSTLDYYHLTEAQLDEAARRNTERLAGYKVEPVETVLCRSTGVNPGILGNLMCMATTASEQFGASILMYPQYLTDLADTLHCDLFLIPASVHEILIVPVFDSDPDSIREMVGDVNDTEVPPEEILSYNVYRYRRDSGSVEIAG